jgi:hypothetical protein
MKKAFWGRKSASTPDSFKYDAPLQREVGWPKQLFLFVAFSLATFSLAAASLPERRQSLGGPTAVYTAAIPALHSGRQYANTPIPPGGMRMPNGTLDLMKLDGQPVTYQIMFEQNAGGTFVARVESDELVPFLHEEMRVELPTAESAAQRLAKENRVRLQNVFLEENNLHAVMDYMEEDI